jgi:hypothetical protein
MSSLSHSMTWRFSMAAGSLQHQHSKHHDDVDPSQWLVTLSFPGEGR